MLLVVDVGNTNTVLGLYDGSRLARRFRIQTDVHRTVDETGVLMLDMFGHAGLSDEADEAIISCVVPDMLPTIRRACREYFTVDPFVVGPGIRTGMPILADNPREVGADRIVNGVAAFQRLARSCVVVDFGTATTFDCVSGKGEYIGGVIAPGFRISAEALFRAASKLPRVEVTRPKRVIGRNTVHSMQSGLYYGYVSLVDGVVARIRDEVDDPDLPVLATGGLAGVVAESSTSISEVAEDLTLEGLRIIWQRNRPSR
jgi:type III pantothenate kinase